MKRQSSAWEKIFANEATDNRLISKIIQTAHAAQYQKHKQSNQNSKNKNHAVFSRYD